MAGAPGLHAVSGDGIALRQLVDGLVDEGDVEVLLHAVDDGLTEALLQLGLDDEHQIPEACAVGIQQGEIDDDVTLIVHGSDLLQTAEAAAHAGSHDNQNRFLHNSLSPFQNPPITRRSG